MKILGNITNNNDITSKEYVDESGIQKTSMPLNPQNGQIVQYIGETNANYTNGMFYQYVDNYTNHIENLAWVETSEVGEEEIANVFVDESIYANYTLSASVELVYSSSTWSAHVVTDEVDSYLRDVDIANYGISFEFNDGYDALTNQLTITFNVVRINTGTWVQKDVSKDTTIQHSSFPSNPQEGDIVQYVGASDRTYTNGMFYQYTQGTQPLILSLEWLEDTPMGEDNEIDNVTINASTFASQVGSSGSYQFVFDGETWSFSGSMIRDINPADYGVTITFATGYDTLTHNTTISFNYIAEVVAGWYIKNVQPMQLSELPNNNEKLEGRIVQYIGEDISSMANTLKKGHFYQCEFSRMIYQYEVDTTVDEHTEGTYYTKRGMRYTEVHLPQDYVAGTTYYKRTEQKQFYWDEIKVTDTFQYMIMPENPEIGQIIQFIGSDIMEQYDHCGIYEYTETDQPRITTDFESSYITAVNPNEQEFMLWAKQEGSYTFTAFENSEDDNQIYWETQKYDEEQGEWVTVEIPWWDAFFLGIEAPDLSQIPEGDTITVDYAYRFMPSWKKTINNSEVKTLESVYPGSPTELWTQSNGLYKITGYIKLFPDIETMYVKDTYFYVINNIENNIAQYWEVTPDNYSSIIRYNMQYHYDNNTGEIVIDSKEESTMITSNEVQHFMKDTFERYYLTSNHEYVSTPSEITSTDYNITIPLGGGGGEQYILVDNFNVVDLMNELKIFAYFKNLNPNTTYRIYGGLFTTNDTSDPYNHIGMDVARTKEDIIITGKQESYIGLRLFLNTAHEINLEDGYNWFVSIGVYSEDNEAAETIKLSTSEAKPTYFAFEMPEIGANHVKGMFDGNIKTQDEINNTISDKLNAQSTYSTSETIVGTWINNKPIYRKTIYINEMPSITDTYDNHVFEKTYQTGLANVETLINMNGIYYGTSQTVASASVNLNWQYLSYSNNVYETSAFISTRISQNSSTLTIRCTDMFLNYDYKGYITLEYTKTSS